MSLSLARQAANCRKAQLNLPRANSLLRAHTNARLPQLSPAILLRQSPQNFRYLNLVNHYSTAAQPSKVEEPAPLNSSELYDSQHIILPNPATASYKVSSRILPSSVSEQLAILNACIQTDSMTRADRVFRELVRSRPEEMKLYTDHNVFNSFLNGFAVSKTVMTRSCLQWFDSMEESLGLKPNVDTYAIVVKAFLRMKSYHTARALLQEVQSSDQFTMKELMESSYVAESDVVLFRELISQSQGANSEEVKELLKELEIATAESLGPMAEPIMAEAAKPEVVIEDVPEALATNTIGVRFLQDQLAALQDQSKIVKMDPYELQLQLEQQGYDVALQKLLHMKEASMERGDTLNAMNLTPLKKIMWDWHESMIPLVKEEIARCDNASSKEVERRLYGPFLKLLPVEKLSIITILELLRAHNSSGIVDGMKTARTIIDVGKAVEMEYNATLMKKSSNKLLSRNHEVHSLFASGKLFNMAVRKAHMKVAREQETSSSAVPASEGDTGGVIGIGEWTPVWPSTIRAKVGSVLTSILIEASKIPVPSRDPETGEKIIENIPAFFHTYQYVRGKRVGIIKFSEPLISMLSREPVRDTLHPRLMPMIVHPLPWLSYNSGGYLSAKSTCMRIRDSPEQLSYLHKASEQDCLNPVLAGLDVLGNTRWRVNKNVFNVILEAWNTGEAIADIPPLVDGPTPLPPKPENYDTDPKAKFMWVSKVKEIQTEDKNNHGLRCDVNYKVETARAFLNLPMYFPHNMDFRGRAYPIPPTLNHLGNDLCRGLLHFDTAKPLGSNGWRWLKIHLANLYGYDKHSFTERENFTEEHIKDIFDSVDNPLTGNKWWLNAENPWQCLSACYEVAAAYRSGTPESFPSQLPVHQDGTCNGLQHYAALGGDLAGAKAVNLAPSDRPADVYTGVADMVNKQIDIAAANGEEYAKILQGKISRKVVKQTVMTNVYGVTFIGARAQIESRLKENPDIPPEKTYVLAGYLASHVFSSLGEMFNGARKIQDWLTDSAKRIARSVPIETLHEAGVFPGDEHPEIQEEINKRIKARMRGNKRVKGFSARTPSSNQMTSVIWTTPLGLPIVQPYRRSGKKQVATLLQTVFIEDPDAARPVNAVKQSTAFPPNFIHSLDATHMLMSAVACHEKDMAFASVHDSYWTHACDVDEMNKVIRDQFIELHSRPIMENLLKEFEERYKDYMLPVAREIGDASKRSAKGAAGSKGKKKKAGEPVAADSVVGDSIDEESVPKDSAIQAMFGLEDTDVDEVDEDGEVEAEATKKIYNRRFLHTWEELKFLPIPQKGEFDINEVKGSDYFFH
ncbi:hypothetical protein CLU79DRAFT_812057 [Phycomyces nitens]|nr:hypothetical protein CLU79DRAFT_812057 [Phycomyces nitens]